MIQNSPSSIPDCFPEYNDFIQAGSVHNGIAAVAFSLTACFVIVTNFTVITGVVKKKVYRIKSMRLFFLLIVADMTIGMVTLPLHVIIYASPTLSIKGPDCALSNIVKFFRIAPVMLSISGVLFISIDRYFAIIKPNLHTRYATNRLLFVVVLIAVVFAFTCGSVNYSRLSRKPMTLSVALTVLGTINIAIFFSVSLIYYAVFRSVRKTAVTTRMSFTNSISSPPKYDRTFSKISVMISACFIMCHLPMTVAYIYIASTLMTEQKSSKTNFYLITWNSLPMYLNSGVNGVLLLYGNRKLKKWLTRVVCEVMEDFRGRLTHSLPPPRVRKNAIVNNQIEQKTIEQVVVNFLTMA